MDTQTNKQPQDAQDQKPATPAPKQAPSVGRIVHYVLPDWDDSISHWSKGDHRPAIIVRVWGAEMVQLQVFTDGSNDLQSGANVMWCTSVHQDETTKASGTWHWPEYVPAQ